MSEKASMEYRLVAQATEPGTSTVIDYLEGQNPHEEGKRQDLQVDVASAAQESVAEGWVEEKSTRDAIGKLTMCWMRRPVQG